MRRFVGVLVMSGLMLGGGLPASAKVKLGEPAPEFTLPDTEGKRRALSEFQGKIVVLEWVNPDCPFVRKHYDSGNMQRLQQTYTARGVVWFSMNSSAPGKQGHLTPDTGKAFVKARHAAPSALLLDPDGMVGRLYGAKTTPHLFIVNPAGALAYQGAIDDVPSTDPADIAAATNYVQRALEELLTGTGVSIPSTKPYGCSVKY